MKRLPHLLTSCLVGLSLPFMLGASVPPSRTLAPNPPNHVVEVNVIDRFLQDTGIRKRPKSSERSRSRNRASRNAIPKPPALASVPLPIPKPVDTAQATAPEKPAQEQPETAENKAASAPTEDAPAAGSPPDAPKPTPETSPQTAAETPADTMPTPEPEKPETPAPAPSDTAKPTTPPPPPPAEPAKDEAAKPPVVEQPATANEPARKAEVPKPLPKPETDTADVAKDAGPADAKDSETAADDTKPDGKQDEDGEKAEAEPPPPPLVKEDPQELQACLADLKAIGAKFEATDPINEGNGCGIENPIDVAEVLPGIDLGGATMRCKTALTMAHWLKQTAQPALDIAMPGRRITGLVPGSTYQCRLRNSASTGKISEHARGNAYDVSAFKLDNGEVIEMKPRAEDSTLEGAFQRTATAGACLHFTTVLSPGSDATHQDHLHLDILERKGGYRYCR